MIIVTGSTGYVGSELIKVLDDLGLRYFGVDKLEKNSETTLQHSLCDKEVVKEVIKIYEPNCIVHCGTNSAGAYQKNFLTSFEEDSLSLINILESLVHNPEIRLIFFSSSYVYSGKAINRKMKEEDCSNPNHNFGIAKHFFESLILRNHPNSVIFRLSNVFGPGKQNNVTAINMWILQCLEGKENIVVWGSGKRRIQYIYIKDVIDFIIKAKTLDTGIYNLGGENYLSMAETAKKLSQKFDVRVDSIGDKKEGETLPFMLTDKIRGKLDNVCITSIDSVLDTQ